MSRRTDTASDVAGLQHLVTAEHAAVFGVAALGGHLANVAPRSPGVAVLRELFDTHRGRRDSWSAALRARHATVPVAAAAYQLPSLGSASPTLAAAAALEQRSARAYGEALTELVDPALRAQATAALADAARHGYALGTLAGQPPAAAAPALPGG